MARGEYLPTYGAFDAILRQNVLIGRLGRLGCTSLGMLARPVRSEHSNSLSGWAWRVFAHSEFCINEVSGVDGSPLKPTRLPSPSPSSQLIGAPTEHVTHCVHGGTLPQLLDA